MHRRRAVAPFGSALGTGIHHGLHACADELVDLPAELLADDGVEWGGGCLHGCRGPCGAARSRPRQRPTPSGVDGASTRGSPRQTGRHPPPRRERPPSTGVLLDHAAMETLQRRARVAGTWQVARRRTRSVPGRGRPHGRHADTKAEYFYIYAGDDPANATDPTGTTTWDEHCSTFGFADAAGHRPNCTATFRNQWCGRHVRRCFPNGGGVNWDKVLAVLCVGSFYPGSPVGVKSGLHLKRPSHGWNGFSYLFGGLFCNATPAY